MNYVQTRHARHRAQNRAIPHEVEELIMKYGDSQRLPGNLYLRRFPRRLLEQLEKAQLVVSENDVIITEEWQSPKKRRKF